MRVPIDPFLALGMHPLSWLDKAKLMPSERLWELRQRVRRGALIMTRDLQSSAWMAEAMDPSFTIAYLRYRCDDSDDGSLFIKHFLRLTDDCRRIPSHVRHFQPITVFAGFELEEGCAYQELHYRVMDQLWKMEAHTLSMIAINPKN